MLAIKNQAKNAVKKAPIIGAKKPIAKPIAGAKTPTALAALK